MQVKDILILYEDRLVTECMILKGMGFDIWAIWRSLECMNMNICCEKMSVLKCILIASDGANVILTCKNWNFSFRNELFVIVVHIF